MTEMIKNKSKHIIKKLTTACLLLAVTCSTVACSHAAKTDDAEAEPAISEQTAIQNAAGLIEDVFSVTVDTENLHVESIYSDWYTVFVDREDDDGYDYSAFVDKQTGEVLHVSKNYGNLTITNEQREMAETYNPDGSGATSSEDLINDCTPIALALVERVFADGRTITQTQFGSIGSDSETSPTQEVAICVRMDEDACYTITVTWPQLDVFSASVYPLGWHSCIYGYQDPAEADEYPPLED